MLEILQFYVSGFWVWLGITFGMVIMLQAVSIAVHAIVEALKR
jgi:D-alanyl-lipoteichoic acid acyltransferase DltB (MBOAT superfamily)